MVLHQGNLRLSIPRSPGSGRLRSEPERKGGAGRYQREESAARVAFEGELCQHAAAEAERRRSLAERRAAYDHAASAAVRAAQDHNTGVDAFEREFLERDPEAVAEFCTPVLDSSIYPEGFARRTRAPYRPDPQQARHPPLAPVIMLHAQQHDARPAWRRSTLTR
jgi:hypothetical protein